MADHRESGATRWLAPIAGAGQGGWVAMLDPRLRIIVAFALALGVLALQHPLTAALAFGLAAVLALSARLSARLLRRGLPFAAVMLSLLLTLPFTVPASGPALLSIGSLSASVEGLRLALLILLKAGTVLLVVMTLLGTLEPAVLGHALGPPGRVAAARGPAAVDLASGATD